MTQTNPNYSTNVEHIVHKQESVNPVLVKENLQEHYCPNFVKPKLEDSGNRREFASGAVRDIHTGKGRFDLMPFDVIAECFERQYGKDDNSSRIFRALHEFTKDGKTDHLYDILKIGEPYESYADMFLEVSKHFEDGAVKYGENNWQKGIPVNSYIDSAARHYFKYQRGDKDEPHDRAFCWNIICAIWTCENKRKLNVYIDRESMDVNPVTKEESKG